MSVVTPSYDEPGTPTDSTPACPCYEAAVVYARTPAGLPPELRIEDVVLLADHEAALAAVEAKLQHVRGCMHALQRYEPDAQGKLRASTEGRYLFVSSALAIVGPKA